MNPYNDPFIERREKFITEYNALCAKHKMAIQPKIEVIDYTPPILPSPVTSPPEETPMGEII